MKPISQDIQDTIVEFLDSQRVAVLSTIGPKDPYSCLMSFDVTRNLDGVFFVTKRARRKYRNIVHNPRVSLVIDNRDNENFDLMGTKVITIIGSAVDYRESDIAVYRDLLKRKHPYLSEFIDEDDTVLIMLKPELVYIIDRFERVQAFEY